MQCNGRNIVNYIQLHRTIYNLFKLIIQMNRSYADEGNKMLVPIRIRRKIINQTQSSHEVGHTPHEEQCTASISLPPNPTTLHLSIHEDSSPLHQNQTESSTQISGECIDRIIPISMMIKATFTTKYSNRATLSAIDMSNVTELIRATPNHSLQTNTPEQCEIGNTGSFLMDNVARQ